MDNIKHTNGFYLDNINILFFNIFIKNDKLYFINLILLKIIILVNQQLKLIIIQQN